MFCVLSKLYIFEGYHYKSAQYQYTGESYIESPGDTGCHSDILNNLDKWSCLNLNLLEVMFPHKVRGRIVYYSVLLIYSVFPWASSPKSLDGLF